MTYKQRSVVTDGGGTSTTSIKKRRRLVEVVRFHLVSEEFDKTLTSLGIFLSPWGYRDFIENNSLSTIVRELWWNRKGRPVIVPAWTKLGFARLKDVLTGKDQSHRALAFAMSLTPLCNMSPTKLKITVGEQIDMATLCGHDDGTRMAWVWFKSLLSTLAAFFWPGVIPPTASSFGNRDSLEMNEILSRTSISKNRGKWKVVEEMQVLDEDWITPSFQGHYRPNQTMCWWWSAGEDRIRATSLDESIAARIIGQCQEDGLKGVWLKGCPDVVLTTEDLTKFKISTDPWESIDRRAIPLTCATTKSFKIPEEFDPSNFPPPLVHETSGIPFETIRGFPCVSKQRHLIL